MENANGLKLMVERHMKDDSFHICAKCKYFNSPYICETCLMTYSDVKQWYVKSRSRDQVLRRINQLIIKLFWKEE